MASFARLATVTAQTKRAAGVTDGLEGSYAVHRNITCLPLDPVDPNMSLGIERTGFSELLQTTVEGDPDILEGDLLVISTVEYPIRAVAEWNWKGTDFLTLYVQAIK